MNVHCVESGGMLLRLTSSLTYKTTYLLITILLEASCGGDPNPNRAR
jgi:hypothetical protein